MATGGPFGSAIKKARRKANISQQKLAELIETDQANIARLEGGKGNPTFETLKKIGEALEYDLVISYLRKPMAGWTK